MVQIKRLIVFAFFISVIFFLFSIPLSNEEPLHSIFQINTDDSLLVKQQIVDPKFQEIAGKIDLFFSENFKKKSFNGVVLFSENNEIVLKKAYGYINVRNKTKHNTNTAFELGSVSKPITAIAILKLYEDGKLDLQDDIRKFFPEFPYENITLHLLLTHRSGLVNYMYFADKYWPDWDIPITNSDVIELLTKLKPNPYLPPDKRYNYSNTGYLLLASVVEKVSGKSFKEYVEEEIFLPLQMEHSFVSTGFSNPSMENVATGHNKFNRPEQFSYLNGVVGDKGIYSTVEDLYKFDGALNNHKLLAKETLDMAFTPRHRDLRKNDNYGYGWRTNTISNNEKIVWHAGWWKGFRAYYIKILHKNQTIIVLDNSTYGRFFKVDELCKLLEEEDAV